MMMHSDISENGRQRANPQWIMQRNGQMAIFWLIATQSDMTPGLPCDPITQALQQLESFAPDKSWGSLIPR